MKTYEKLPEKLGGTYVYVEWKLDGENAIGESIDGNKYVFTGTPIIKDGILIDIEDSEFEGQNEL